MTSGQTDHSPDSAWQLPPVSDRWWTRAKAALAILLAVAAVMEVLGLRANYQRAMLKPFAHIGLSGWTTYDGKAQIRAPHTAEAIDAGLREGQTIIAVDGVEVGNRMADMEQVDRLLIGPEGTQVTIRTRDPAGRVAEHRVTRSRANADALYAGSGISAQMGVIIMLITMAVPDIFILIVAAILLRSRRRETVGLLFALAFIGLVLTGPTTYSLYSTPWQVRLSAVIGAATLMALAIALLAFPDGRIEGRTRKAILVIIGIIAVLAAVMSGTVGRYAMIALIVTAVSLPTIALIARARRADSGGARQQIRFALFGFAIGATLVMVAFALNILMPPQTLDNAALLTWMFIGALICGATAIIALAGGLLLSLLRYRLYDVDTLISRSAAYGLMTVGFVAVFAGLENLLEQAAQTYLSDNAGKAAGAISAALAAGLIGPMHSRIHGWTERRFRKGLVAMRSELPREIDDLRETASFEELAAVVEPAIARGVNAEWVRLRPPGLLNAQDVDLRGELERPIATTDGRALSLLEIGPRPDGSPHGKDEREAIDALAGPLARALTVIERREAKEQAIERRIGALEAAIAKLTPARRQKPRLAN